MGSRRDLYPPLRPYQLEAGRAIMASVARGQGLSFSVEIARQGGKNELSARLELLTLVSRLDREAAAVKAAPTFRPQALISMRRLWSLVQRARLTPLAARESGYIVRLGRARQVFLSAEPTSNVVGHTADLLLEIDEAQDVDIEKYDKELRPMAASTGATTVLYGTAWDGSDLLERAKQEHLEAERRDGVRRHFEYDWRVVAAANPSYGRFVLGERERLGEDHPLFQTQFCLKPLKGAGRLFSDAQLSLMRGGHPALTGPLAGDTYAAGLDVGGEGGPGHDATVLTIGRVIAPREAGAQAETEVVASYAWRGAPHAEVQGALVSLLGSTWRVRRLAVDATGIGEPVAALLAKALPRTDVAAIKVSADSKSRLGYGLIAAVNRGGLRMPAPDAGGELAEYWRQLRACRVAYRANRTINFYVTPAEGHDDHVFSLSLLVEAAAGITPRRARGRDSNDESASGGHRW